MDGDENTSTVLRAFADPLRLRILRLLPETDEKCEDVYNVSELAVEIGVSQPTVSHHLCILRRAGIVKCRKMCRDVYYWKDKETFERLLSTLRGLLEDEE